MSVYHVRNWHRYQRDFITRALRQRRTRAIKRYLETGEIPERIDEHHPMTYLRVDVNLDAEINALEDLGMGPRAEGILLRLLRHVAATDAMKGEVHAQSTRSARRVHAQWKHILRCTPRFADVCVRALLERRIIVEGGATLPLWMKALTDVSTIPEEAENGKARAPSRNGTRSTSRAPSRAHIARPRQERNSPPTSSLEGGRRREVPAAASACAAGRTGTRGVDIPEHLRIPIGTPGAKPNYDPADPRAEFYDGEVVLELRHPRDPTELPTGTPYRWHTPDRSTELLVRGSEPPELEIPPVPPEVDQAAAEAVRRLREARQARAESA